MTLPPPLPIVSFVSAKPAFFFFNKLFWKCGISDAACTSVNTCFSLQFIFAFLVYVHRRPVTILPPFILPFLFLPLVLPADTCLSEDSGGHMFDIAHTNPHLSAHIYTQAGSPSLRSGSAAEKVTGWATIKRVRARRSFVIATRDADGELLSSVNDKSMKFPSCSHLTHTHNHSRTYRRGY